MTMRRIKDHRDCFLGVDGSLGEAFEAIGIQGGFDDPFLFVRTFPICVTGANEVNSAILIEHSNLNLSLGLMGTSPFTK